MFENVVSTIVFLGFDMDILEFNEIMESNDFIKSLNLKRRELKLLINNEANYPDEIVKNIQETFPIAILENNEIEISNIGPQQKLLLKAKNYNNVDKNLFIRVAQFFYSWNMYKIKKIGINFKTNETLVPGKLKLLNPDIERTKDWDKNITFVLTIPYKYDNYIANYKIQKLVREKESELADRVYQVSVNYDYELKRQEESSGENVIEDIETLYDAFKVKGKEFLGLKYE